MKNHRIAILLTLSAILSFTNAIYSKDIYSAVTGALSLTGAVMAFRITRKATS